MASNPLELPIFRDDTPSVDPLAKLPRLAEDSKPLPMTVQEMRERGWDQADIVFVTGDAYIDHPSFAMALLGRVLQAAGFRVGIISQPDWQSCADWQRFGRPRDRKSTRLNSSHIPLSRMPSSA